METRNFRQGRTFEMNGKLIDAIEAYIRAHNENENDPQAITALTNILKKDIPEMPATLAKFPKDELSDGLLKITSIIPLGEAITLCQHALCKNTALGKRFWKQGPRNKSGFDRGTIKEIYDLLQTLLAKIHPTNKTESNDHLQNAIQNRIALENPSVGKKETPTYPIDNCWTAHKQTKFLATEKLFIQALKTNPFNAEAYFEYGELYFIFENYNQIQNNQNNHGWLSNATRRYTVAIWQNPNESKFFLARSKSYFLGKNYNEALNDINEAIELAPNSHCDYYVHQAIIYCCLGDFNKALAAYDQGIKLFPTNSLIFIERGEFHAKRDNIKAAVNDFVKAATLIRTPNPGIALNETLYETLQTILTEATDEALARVSKKDLLVLLKSITPLLKKEDAIELYELAADQNSNLGKRLYRTSGRRAFFDLDPAENATVQEIQQLLNNLKPHDNSSDSEHIMHPAD